jgi:hypothetical protein
MVATDYAAGDLQSSGTETLQLIQSATNPQTVSFGDNQVITQTFSLDGSQGNFQDWGTGDSNNSFNQNRIYFLTNGTADCSSVSGV